MYQIEPVEITQSMIDDYRQAIGFEGEGTPLMFHVVPLFPLLMACATDTSLGFDLTMLVHAGHQVRMNRMLVAGDVVHCSGSLQGTEEKPHGILATFDMFLDVGEERVAEVKTEYFIRKPGLHRKGRKKPAFEGASREVMHLVDAAMAERYAEASGDHNPIHLDETFAKSVGLPGVILHGLCTMALAANGAPCEPRLFRARFSRPVRLGQTLKSEWRKQGQDWAFCVKDEDDKIVLTDGYLQCLG